MYGPRVGGPQLKKEPGDAFSRGLGSHPRRLHNVERCGEGGNNGEGGGEGGGEHHDEHGGGHGGEPNDNRDGWTDRCAPSLIVLITRSFWGFI